MIALKSNEQLDNRLVNTLVKGLKLPELYLKN